MPTLEDLNLEEKAGYGEPEVPSYSEPDPQPRPMGIPVPDAPRLQPVKPLDQQQRANDMLANYQKVGSSSFPAANGGSSAPQGGRDYLERQNSLAKSVTPLGKGGSTGAIAGAVASKVPTSVDDLAKAGVQKLIGNSAGAQRIAGAVDTAQKAVRAIYGGDIKAGAELLIKYWKVVVALILAAELPFLLIAIAIAASLGSVGNPAGGVPVSANTQYVSARCAEMQSTLPYKNSNGKTDLLTLFATEGQFSKEQPYDVEKAPKSQNSKGGGGISLDSYRSQDPSSPHYFPDSWKPYYASGRWGYTASRFDVGPIGHDPSTKIFPGVSSGADYAGRKIIFYNPANGKAAVAIAMDWGPNTGVFKDRSSSNLEQQRQLWNGAGSLDGYRITNPPNDPTALVGGGPDTLATALGVDQYSQVEMGFATDQSVDPTKPFKCTPVTSQAVSSGISGKGYLVCIDPGHGGSNGGAVGADTGLSETKAAWEVAVALSQKLKSSGYSTLMVKQSEDQTVANGARAHMCNSAEANVAIHIHVNDGPQSASGFQVYVPSKISGLMTQVNLTASQKAGAAFHGAFSTSINGGVKDRNRGEVPDSENQHGGLTVSNESTVPTLLVEMFFINNTNDATWYKNDGVNKMADAFLAGIGAIKKSQIEN